MQQRPPYQVQVCQSAKYFLCAGNSLLLLTLAHEQILLQYSRLKSVGFYFQIAFVSVVVTLCMGLA